MTEERNEEKTGRMADERDLRSILTGRASAPQGWSRPREGEARQAPPGGPRPPEPKPGKLPPVWPGDEKREWFRRERGLPPLPHEPEPPHYLQEDLPTGNADISSRVGSWIFSILIPGVLSMAPYASLSFAGTVLLLGNVVLFRQGQDMGAKLFRVRVVRENGDVAGFFLMWTRAFASLLSLLPLGAGYWAMLSDPENGRTWHDRWLGTFVVKDSPEYRHRRRSSPDTARKWFWITLMMSIAAAILMTMAYASLESSGQQ